MAKAVNRRINKNSSNHDIDYEPGATNLGRELNHYPSPEHRRMHELANRNYYASLERRKSLRKKRDIAMHKNYRPNTNRTVLQKVHGNHKPKPLINKSVYEQLPEHNMKIQFREYSCLLDKTHYVNSTCKQIALVLTDDETYAPIATASVCLPEYKFGEKQTAIKDYAENEGMLDCLIEAGVVKDTGLRVEQGWVTIPIVEVLI